MLHRRHPTRPRVPALAAARAARLRRHFDHSVWLNTIPSDEWERAYGSMTIRMIREVFPMFELTLDGLTAGIRKLMVARSV